MKQPRHIPRAAIALLFAGIALPLSPSVAQTPTVQSPPLVNAPPPVTTPTPAPPVVSAPTPQTVSPTPAPRVETSAPAAPRASSAPARTSTANRSRPDARPAARQTRAATRAAAAAPVAAAAPAAPTPAPAAEPVAPAATLPPPPAPVDIAPADAAPAETAGAGSSIWPWLLAALAIAGIGIFAWTRLRRRRTEEVYYEEEAYPHAAPAFAAEPELAYHTPVAAAPILAETPEPAIAPVAAVPVAAGLMEGPARADTEEEVIASVDAVSVTEPDDADVEALAAASVAPDGRPWIEFLMRPIRAGTTDDDTVVEFELTVGNTGSIAAKDVRISTWMFAAGSSAESEMERMLIDPPAEATVSEVSIEPGDGARVEASLALPKSSNPDAVLPVVVADARYRLPDGSEGRTSASFEIGLPGEDALGRFPVDRASGLFETVEARLHGELERT